MSAVVGQVSAVGPAAQSERGRFFVGVIGFFVSKILGEVLRWLFLCLRCPSGT